MVVVNADGVAQTEEWNVSDLRRAIPPVERAHGGGRTVTHVYSNDTRRLNMATACGMAKLVNERIEAGSAAGLCWGSTDIVTGPFSSVSRATLVGTDEAAELRAVRLARPGEGT